MSRVLMIAYHYPPVGFSSGVHRTLKFSQYLPENGWDPLMLTVHPQAYERLSDDQLKDIPSDILVTRARAFDVARHLSIRGRYPGFLALPDRWSSWFFTGVLAGLKIIRQHKPEVIWSTYPISTAHLIGWALHKMTGIPWVVDFRDSMTENEYPVDLTKRKIFQWIEKKAILNSTKVIFTTPGAMRMYAQRYPECSDDHWAIIENGYDEEKFSEIEAGLINKENQSQSPLITLVHSGLLYPSERNPIHFFEAIAALKNQSIISVDTVNIILRASGHEDVYSLKLKALNIEDIITLAPPVSYGEALREMLDSDGLLLFQGTLCNHQIPAKVYEYIRARKPVFALTDLLGDTAGVLEKSGITSIVPLDSKSDIMQGLTDFLHSIKDGNAPVACLSSVAQHSRKHKAEELVQIFNNIGNKK